MFENKLQKAASPGTSEAREVKVSNLAEADFVREAFKMEPFVSFADRDTDLAAIERLELPPGRFRAISLHRSVESPGLGSTQELPVLDVIAAVREQIHSFIDDNLGPQGRVGFMADHGPEMNIQELKKKLEEALAKARLLEKDDRYDGIVQHSTAAEDVADVLDEHLAHLRLEFGGDMIPQNEQEAMLISLVQLKTQLASATQELMMESFQATAARDLQSIQNLVTPEMLAASGGEIEIDVAGTILEAASKSAQKLLQGGEHEVMTVAREMKSALREVSSALRKLEPEQMGFLQASPQQPVSVTALVETLSNGSARLERIFADRTDTTPIGIQMRTIAQNLQTAADVLRIPLVRRGFGEDGIAVGRSGSMLVHVRETEGRVGEAAKAIKGFLRKLQEQSGNAGPELRVSAQ